MKVNKSIKSIEKLNERLSVIERNEEETQQKKVSAEAKYQDLGEHWHFHDSSWYMRGVNGYDGYGCNQFTGCIPECRYYVEEARVEDEGQRDREKTSSGVTNAKFIRF